MKFPLMFTSTHKAEVGWLNLTICQLKYQLGQFQRDYDALSEKMLKILNGKFTDKQMVGTAFASWNDEEQAAFWEGVLIGVSVWPDGGENQDMQWCRMTGLMSKNACMLLKKMGEFASMEETSK